VIGHYLGGGQGLPKVLVLGILVGLFRFVPYVGVWIGASFPLLLSFALFPGYSAFFATLGLFIVLEIVISQFIEPVWYGASTGMSALAVLVAAVFWTWLWGPIGLLLTQLLRAAGVSRVLTAEPLAHRRDQPVEPVHLAEPPGDGPSRVEDRRGHGGGQPPGRQCLPRRRPGLLG